MFIAMRDNQIHQSPRGATGDSVKRKGNLTQRAKTQRTQTGKQEGSIRRGWVPQPVGRGDLAPTMDGPP